MDVNDIQEHPEKLYNIQRMIAATMRAYEEPDCPLYGNLFVFSPTDVEGSDLTGLYVVMGRDPMYQGPTLPAGLDLAKQARIQERDPLLFHTDLTVIDLSKVEDELNLSASIVNWASTVAALHHIFKYEGHKNDIPKAIRSTEIDYLTQHQRALWDDSVPPGAKHELRQNLAKYFSREGAAGFKGEWRSFFRSDKMPPTKNKLVQFQHYMKRHESEVPLNILMEGCDEVSKLTITERAYKAFAKEVKEHHPDVTYAVSKPVIQDEGVDKTPGETFRGITRVTEDEYNTIKTERFAREGWRALQGLQVAKWELRDLYFKRADTEIVSSILLKEKTRFVKPMGLSDLQGFGKFSVYTVDAADFDNFVSMMHANMVPFGLDIEGRFHSVSLSNISVLVPDMFKEKYLAVREYIVNANITMAGLNTVRFGALAPAQGEGRPFELTMPGDGSQIETRPVDDIIRDAESEANKQGRQKALDRGQERG